MNIIDIETYKGIKGETPYCLVINYGGRNIKASGEGCIDKVLNWIFNNCSNLTVFYAHNLTFDGLILINHMSSSYEVSSKHTSMRNCNLYSLCLSRGEKQIVFKCSAKLLPLQLKEIAIIIGVEGKLDLDHEKVTRAKLDEPGFTQKALKYCERDVQITQAFMNRINYSLIKFLPEWRYTVYTISGLALKLFSKLFNNYKINLNLESYYEELTRPSYYGGRCEVFGNAYGDEKIRHFDFSGMYTNRLRETYPIGEPLLKYVDLNINEVGFYSVRVTSENFFLPILPLRDLKTGKLKFVNGTFNGVYWYEELKLFVENGGIVENIYWGVTFKSVDKPFLAFAEFCLERRKENPLNNILWKLIPNSFIGRLGLRQENSETKILNDSTYDHLDPKIIRDKKINNRWLVKLMKLSQIKEKSYGNVMYSAITTSKARILWWKSATIVQKAGGRLLYCDTDSLYVAFKEEVLGKTMGEVFWDPAKKDTVVEKACFISSKFYVIKNKGVEKIKLKGIREKATQNTNFYELEKLFYNDGSKKFFQQLWEKKNWNIRISQIEKEVILRDYDKRIFYNGKKETKPHRV